MTTKYLILNWSKAQKAGASLPCPRCGRDMNENLYHNALSRRADIYICSHCGTEEAWEDIAKGKPPATSEQVFESWFLTTTVLGKPKIRKIGNEIYKLRVYREVYLTNEDIDDIMSCALEGGITYWCKKAEVIEDNYLGEYASEQISRGGSLRIYDAEDDTTSILTLDSFIKGFVMACNNGYGETHGWYTDDNKIDTCQIDGEAADVIIQYALFDDVIYG